jgi:hypothetical protein
VTLAFWFVLVPTLCYAGAAVYYLYIQNMPMVIIYSGYAWANVGLLWIELLRTK